MKPKRTGQGALRNNATNPHPDDELPVSRFTVILVEPQYRDNVGHTARTMLNFGVSDLVLVNAPPVDEETRVRAVHAQKVLDRARHVATLADARKDVDTLVGFAARISKMDKAHRRMSDSLPDVARRLDEVGGRIGLVFGREDFGLSNEDVETCDMLCTIPTAPTYRSMNLSHAVSVGLYELTRPEHARMPHITMATAHEKDVLYATWRHLNESLGFRPHRVSQADQMFRRLVGRVGLTSWEYHRMMGPFHRMLRNLHAWPPPNLPAFVEEEGEEEAEEGGHGPGPGSGSGPRDEGGA